MSENLPYGEIFLANSDSVFIFTLCSVDQVNVNVAHMY